MSERCPLCGEGFVKGEPVETAVMTVPGGFAGVSFHQRCFTGDPKGAQAIIDRVEGQARQIARDLAQPTPGIMH